MKIHTSYIDRSKDAFFMQKALLQAKQAALLGEVPVGAVLVYKGEIIGTGFNRPISQQDPSAHAEVVAIREAAKHMQNYRLLDTTLYVTLEPCSMCAGLLMHARIHRLVYGTTEPKAGAIESQDRLLDKIFFNHKIITEGGILAEECAQLLKQFFKQKRL